MIRFRFRSIRNRLTALYAGLFTLAIVVIALLLQVLIVQNATQSVRAELTASSSVYDRIWNLRSAALADSADVLARDFGFRSAVATNDVPTIRSALDNLRNRARVDTAFMIGEDGHVVGNGDARLRARVAGLPWELEDGQSSGLFSLDGQAFRAIVAPIRAPAVIGYIVFAVHIDRREMTAIERLSAIPLQATVLHRVEGQAWHADGIAAADIARIAPPDGSAAARAEAAPIEAAIGGIRSFVLLRPLPAAGSTEALLVLRYPVSLALADFRPLQVGMLMTGLVGLFLVLLASFRLARNIARPISALGSAARALEAGERTEVAVVGEDEIAGLARSFNAMARGIFEREDRITHLAFNDVLTELPNRVFFRQQLEARLRQADKNGEQVAILTLDLDGFKSVNDTLGHPFGDLVLKQAGAIIQREAPDSFVARLGGDEFAIILPLHSGSEEARTLAQRICTALVEPILIAEQQTLIGTSIGIAIAPGDGASADVLLKNADLALYRAKQDGRGLFRFFQISLDIEAQARRQMEIDLRQALKDGDFELNFQPIFDQREGHIVCFEALMRWPHREHGLVPPSRFIPIAEECGLIVRIGEWVLHEACRQASRWPGDIRVAVNVSPGQFRNPGLNAAILQALANSGVDPSRLEIEITESIFLESCADTIAMLHSLRALGVRIALDDFGTGYSSLSYLSNFPFDKIKIDKSFVDRLGEGESARAIVQAIINLASALGMETTAEGVETEAQFDALRAQGCKSIQGFLLSRPLSAADAFSLSGGEAGSPRGIAGRSISSLPGPSPEASAPETPRRSGNART